MFWSSPPTPWITYGKQLLAGRPKGSWQVGIFEVTPTDSKRLVNRGEDEGIFHDRFCRSFFELCVWFTKLKNSPKQAADLSHIDVDYQNLAISLKATA